MAREYKIIRASTLQSLEHSVSESLKAGWSLHGDFKIEMENGNRIFLQAMIK